MMLLPEALRRLPYVIYGLCAIFFVWSVINSWMLMTAYGTVGDLSLEGVMASQKSEALFRASLDSVYLLVNGAILHVLIAIFDRLKGQGK